MPPLRLTGNCRAAQRRRGTLTIRWRTPLCNSNCIKSAISERPVVLSKRSASPSSLSARCGRAPGQRGPWHRPAALKHEDRYSRRKVLKPPMRCRVQKPLRFLRRCREKRPGKQFTLYVSYAMHSDLPLLSIPLIF